MGLGTYTNTRVGVAVGVGVGVEEVGGFVAGGLCVMVSTSVCAKYGYRWLLVRMGDGIVDGIK